MPERRELSVRGTPVQMLEDGAGPPLLFLHGAGGAGRWLPFQERLAKEFTVRMPSHPGHGGSPAADWLEHISDLAFHYLDLLDALGLERVHLVGASFGGWIAAELATMASHRLRSLVLIDPVGIKVDGWIYPFLPTSTTRSCAAGSRASPRRPSSAGAPTTGSPRSPRAERRGSARSPGRASACSPTRVTCLTSRSRARSRRR